MLFGLAFLSIGFFHGRLYGTRHPGLEPYAPTKITWLAVESHVLLNATLDCASDHLIVVTNSDRPHTLNLVIRTTDCISGFGRFQNNGVVIAGES